MQIQSAFNASLAGLQQASSNITDTSRSIAENSLPSEAEQQAQGEQNIQQQAKPSTVDNLTSLVEDKNFAAANVKALQTSNEVLGSIIDIKA